MTFRLLCLLCGEAGGDLVAMQEHLRDEHYAPEGPLEQEWRAALSNQTHESQWPNESGELIYILPDGRPWMLAQPGSMFQ